MWEAGAVLDSNWDGGLMGAGTDAHAADVLTRVSRRDLRDAQVGARDLAGRWVGEREFKGEEKKTDLSLTLSPTVSPAQPP